MNNIPITDMDTKFVPFMFIVVLSMYAAHYVSMCAIPLPETTHTRFDIDDRTSAVRACLLERGCQSECENDACSEIRTADSVDVLEDLEVMCGL